MRRRRNPPRNLHFDTPLGAFATDTDKVLTIGNPKTKKGESFGYLTGVLHLQPANLSGFGNVCEWAARCAGPCLNMAGRAAHGPVAETIFNARRRRTWAWFNERDKFLALLRWDIDRVIRMADQRGLRAAFRLNGTSDIRWESETDIFREYSNEIFYDYTKDPVKTWDWISGSGAFTDVGNYHLTFSFGGKLDGKRYAAKGYRDILDSGTNIAAVWIDDRTLQQRIGTGVRCLVIVDGKGNLVRKFDLGIKTRVIDGDNLHGDLRFLDPEGVIVGLYAKTHTTERDKGSKRFFQNPDSGCDTVMVMPSSWF